MARQHTPFKGFRALAFWKKALIVLGVLLLFSWSLEWIDPEWVAEQRAREAEEAHQEALREQADRDREKNAPGLAVSGSVFDGNVLGVEGYYGTLDLTLTQEFTAVWELVGCDQQQANLSVMFRKWKRQYGDEAHTVVIHSWAGREIGKFSRLRGYHCG